MINTRTLAPGRNSPDIFSTYLAWDSFPLACADQALFNCSLNRGLLKVLEIDSLVSRPVHLSITRNFATQTSSPPTILMSAFHYCHAHHFYNRLPVSFDARKDPFAHEDLKYTRDSTRLDTLTSQG